MIPWKEFRASDLRAPAPPAPHLRLRRPYVSAPGPALPHGGPRPAFVRVEASFDLGGQLHFLARVVRREGQTVLQVQPEALDIVRSRAVPLEPSPALLSQVLAALTTAYLAAAGRSYGRTEGRN